MSEHNHDLRRADFSERAAAFAVDYALFAVAWVLILKIGDRNLPVLLNEKGTVVMIFLAALFIVYQAFFSSAGRVTVGKRLLGLRVVDAQGEPIRFAEFGTVVSERPAGGARGMSLRIAAGALIVTGVLAAGWTGVWERRYLKLMTVAHAKAGFAEVKYLQTAYHRKNGRYADSLFALAGVSVDPRGFLRDMAILYDLKALRFKADRVKWAVAARARDVDSTLVAAHGP